MGAEDVPGVVDLLNETAEDWLDWPRVDEAEVQRVLDGSDSGFGWVAVTGGRLVGFIRLFAVDVERRQLWLEIRSRGAAPDTIDALVRVAQRLAARRAAQTGGVVLRCNVESRQEDVRAALVRTHFVPVRRPVRMLAKLSAPQPRLATSEGVRIRPFDNRAAQGIHDLVMSALGDSGTLGFVPTPYVNWYIEVIESRDFRPDFSFMAEHDDQLIGVALASVAATDESLAWFDVLAVRRDWRGRGVAGALMSRVLAAMHDSGFRRVGCGTDLLNPTDPHRVASAAGFGVFQEFEVLERWIAGPPMPARRLLAWARRFTRRRTRTET
jgi:GNAT superfamily N-acetyltransferase